MREELKRDIKIKIMKRMVELQAMETMTSKGEPISMAAIGRTLDPPVSRVTVRGVISGEPGERVRRAIEKELRLGRIWHPKPKKA